MKFLSKSLLASVLLGMLLFVVSCNSGSGPKYADPNVHKVLVKEVQHVSEYTYLLVTENGTDQWLAVPKMDAKPGETYYYGKGMMMTNFPSKDLGKTFESIVFVEKISADPNELKTSSDAHNGMGMSPSDGMGSSMPGHATTGGMPKPSIEKVEVQVESVSGGITIAQLAEKKEQYANKTVIVRGQVTKVNNGIMGKNWVHIQDGTQFDNIIDLTVTTAGNFNVGDKVTFEAKVALNKDFGYGYSYELLLEDGVAK